MFCGFIIGISVLCFTNEKFIYSNKDNYFSTFLG
jgi:hypothetical protein